MSILNVIHVCAFALTAALFVSGMMRGARITDMPDGRSSHDRPTPTSGGLGVVFGMLCAMAALCIFYPNWVANSLLLGLGGLGLCMAVLGFVDDLKDLSPRLKFVLMIFLALLTPLVTGTPQALPLGAIGIGFHPVIAWGGAALWVFVVMNIVNFMDGANGLMGGFMMIASAGLYAVCVMAGVWDVAILAVCLSAAIFGFLVYNARPVAQIFCGDVGSLFIGFLFAALSLRLSAGEGGAYLLYVGPLLLLPFLVDSLMTILVRAKRKEPLMAAHRSHLYQRALIAGRTHLWVSSIYAFTGVLAVIAGLYAVHSGFISSAFYFSVCLCLGVWTYVAVHVRLKRGEDITDRKV